MNYIYRSDYLRMREMTDDAKDEGKQETLSILMQLKNGELSVSDAAVKLNISEEKILELLK